MAITHAFVLNTVDRSDGTRLVMLRITAQRKHKYIDTGVAVPEKHWNPAGDAQKKNWIFKANGRAVELNETLSAWQNRLTTLIQRLIQAAPGTEYTAEQVKARLLGRQSQSLSAYIEAKIDQYAGAGQDDNARNHRAMLTSLRKFLFGFSPQKTNVPPTVTLANLTPERIREYEAWLLAQPLTRRTSTPASRRNYATDRLRRLRQHIVSYIALHRLPSEADPTRAMKFTTVESQPVWLTQAELIRWEDARLETATRGQRSIDAARIVYLASYYLHGIRAGDLLSLRVGQIEQVWEIHENQPQHRSRLFYTSDKKDKTKSVLIEPYLQTMLSPFLLNKAADAFIFPFLPARLRHWPEAKLGPEIDKRVSYVNRLLKAVSATLGTNPNVSMHSARRSFADALYDQTGDLRLVQNALHHTNIITTQRYVTRGKQQIVDQANALYARRSAETPLKQTAKSGETNEDNEERKQA